VRKHFSIVGIGVAAVTAALLAPAVRAAGQSSTAAPSAAAKADKAPAKTAAIKRLPDGTPDIRGAWVKNGGGLNEAKVPYSETALKPFGVLSEPQGFGQGAVTAGPGGKPVAGRGRGAAPTNRPPVGIVDPPDRMLPYTQAALAERQDRAKNMCCPAKSLDYIEPGMRCIPAALNGTGNLYITQRPGEVALLFETNHQARIVYTDGRPHPPASVTSFQGHSIGHWEGTTLVVDTTNFDGRMYFGVGNTLAPFSKQLHATERYTVQSDKLITFELIYDDPKTFTKPVKVAGYLAPPDTEEEFVPEFTCHEGSYALIDTFGF